MRYLITTITDEPFLTEWFDLENNFSEELDMVVFDLAKNIYTDDGETWKPITVDHL